MPLYEFLCRDCERQQELLIRNGDEPVCESCGGKHMLKLLSVPIAHGSPNESGSRPQQGPSGSCGAHCGCHPH